MEKANTSARFLIIVVNLFLCSVLLKASDEPPPKIPANFANHFSKSGVLSFTVRNSTTGALEIDVNSMENTMPASTQKIVTTWIALDILGPQKTWTTEFKYTGSIQNGILKGDLVIQGGGDPAFGSSRFGSKNFPESIFHKWNAELEQLGITQITGCVKTVSNFEDDEFPNRYANFEDIGNYYAGLTSGLCYRDNQYSILLQGSSLAGIPIVVLGTDPKHTGIQKFENFLVTGLRSSSDLAYIFGSPLSEKRILKGTYPAGKKNFEIKGSLPHPTYTCAKEFTEFLESRRILFLEGSKCNLYPEEAGVPVKSGSVFTSISSHTSPELAAIVQYILRTSDNNYSDQLLVLLGKELGRRASRKEGLKVLRKYLLENKFKPAEFHLKDGSGLSRKNWVSGNFMTGLLYHASKSKHFKIYKNGFRGSAASDSRKIKRYGKEWTDKLWIKTGYLEGISTFAGYFKGKSGAMYSFYFSLNNSDRPDNIRREFGKILEAVANQL